MIIIRLLLAVIIVAAAALLGEFFTKISVNSWYTTLSKSSLTPPPYIFSYVWTAIYILMALSFFLILQKKAKGQRVGGCLTLFILQLLLNVTWSFLFFGLKSPQYALLDMGLLLFFVLLTIFAFDRVSKWAALLLLPYLFWLGFAAYLNVMIVHLNF
jgi:translocator protein